MNFEEYQDLYLTYVGERPYMDSEQYDLAVDDAYSYDPDEWNYRGAFREYLVNHPEIEFHECETAGAQGICQKAGTFCDHFMVSHNNAYWQN